MGVNAHLKGTRVRSIPSRCQGLLKAPGTWAILTKTCPILPWQAEVPMSRVSLRIRCRVVTRSSRDLQS